MNQETISRIEELITGAMEAATLKTAGFGFPEDRIKVEHLHFGGAGFADGQVLHPDEFIKKNCDIHHRTWIIGPLRKALKLLRGEPEEGEVVDAEFQPNHELLRPFDIEAAKRGDPVKWFDQDVRWLGLSVHQENRDFAQNIVEHPGGLSYVRDEELRMAPLAWIEGRPVYKGDVLWHRVNEETVVVDEVDGKKVKKNTGCWRDIEYLTWERPKVKREGWLNIYRGHETGGKVYDTKDGADIASSGYTRLTCVRIEWEEPAE